MKKVLFIILLAGLTWQTAKPVSTDNSAVIGAWKCSVVDVPYEYSTSVITVTEKEGKLAGTVKFDSGEEIKLTTVKYSDNKLIMTLYVEGYSINVDGKVSGLKITGTVDTPDGKVNFTANKVVEKTK